ncbi:DUF222 domain-containing protein [Amycolatopsis nigrescens]|uniref:DUF222 domain-containing protein n=1 Tax=Amycolatopsis nigrescens TaxID=381445 RepID=UPI0009FD9CB8|nr:DUF222 domain-containing protein [Amycolatopsis nigrescens]
MDKDKACALLKEIRVLQEDRCRSEAAQLRLIAQLNELGERTKGVPAELALGLAITENAAVKQIALAEALVTRLPSTLEAMESGTIDTYKASKIVDATVVLTDAKAREVDLVMAGRLAGKNPQSLRRAVRRVVARIDPDGHATRTRHRRRDRKVTLLPRGEGMSTLILDLPAELGAAIYTRTDRDAHALNIAGETRTLDQLRADVLTDRCLWERGTRRNLHAEVHLYVDLTTLAGLNNNPAELAGTGPIPAWLARDIANNPASTWHRIVTDPTTATPIDVSRRTYRSPTALDGHIRVPNPECNHPGCYRPIQLGDSTETNPRYYCKHHKKLKNHPSWTYTHNLDGTLTVTTPAKAVYRSTRGGD